MHQKFDFPVNDKPGFLPDDLMKMRLDFIFEELTELALATGFGFNSDYQEFVKLGPTEKDLEKALDGLVDLSVVTLGTATFMGFANPLPISVNSPWATIWSEAWSRVMKANMAKVKGPTSRGHAIDLQKPEGWEAPQFKDLLV
jgi:predicted HAD superfamily Cof-like phosphohydrolase